MSVLWPVLIGWDTTKEVGIVKVENVISYFVLCKLELEENKKWNGSLACSGNIKEHSIRSMLSRANVLVAFHHGSLDLTHLTYRVLSAGKCFHPVQTPEAPAGNPLQFPLDWDTLDILWRDKNRQQVSNPFWCLCVCSGYKSWPLYHCRPPVCTVLKGTHTLSDVLERLPTDKTSVWISC